MTRVVVFDAYAGAVLLGVQLDHRSWFGQRGPAARDDVLSLAVCAADTAAVRAARLVRDWQLIRSNWKALLLLGTVGIGTHNALAYLGLNYTTATNGVILNSFIPVMIVALSWMFLRERLTSVQLAGVATSLAGVLTIISGGSLAALAAFRPKRRRSARHSLDGHVVGLHDLPALASAGPRYDHVLVRDRVRR